MQQSPQHSLWLLLNIGNTHSKAALYSPSGAGVAQVRFTTDAAATADEFRVVLSQLFASVGHPEFWSRIGRVITASVVPAIDTVIVEALEHVGVPGLMVGPHLRGGFQFGIAQPELAGADRLANIAGGIALTRAPFVIVDAGTATTFSVVDPDGRYVGGAIAPGMETSWIALQTRAAKLSSVRLLRPASSPGGRTEQQLQSGVILGHETMIEAMVDRIIADAGYLQCALLATGGCLRHLELSARFTRQGDLTFRGLYRYGQLNG